MNLIYKLFAAAALASVSMSASAVEAHIKVWADIDPTLALLKANGSAIDDAVKLEYRPGRGLTPWTEQVRIYSNDIGKDVEVRLAQSAQLNPSAADVGAVAVPLSVQLNGRLLTTTVTNFLAAELFSGATVPGGSIIMPLTVSQTTEGVIAAAGSYEGMVSLVLNQKTTGP
ncbi:MAG: CS1 type fimbrial major subunit [Stenotrophomonas maltophilia]